MTKAGDAFTLEKMRIHDRLLEVERETNTLRSRFDSEYGNEITEGNVHRNIKEIRKTLDHIEIHICGDGGAKIGIKTRVDRIEISWKVFAFTIGITWTIVLYLFFKLKG